MNLHEYQSKQVFREYGIPVPEGIPADSPDKAVQAAKDLGGELWVVKAQVHAGGRGKAGGVKLCRTLDEVRDETKAMLGQMLVTHQTDSVGLPINMVYVESGSQIERELYLSIVIDRASERVSVMASADGGMDIEEVAEKTPERIKTLNINPVTGLMPYQAREIGFGIGLGKVHMREFTRVMMAFYKMFIEKDLTMLEINPLIVTGDDRIMALDGKVDVEDNSLFRQQAMQAFRDPTQEDEMENKASAHDLNYVSLDGDIACMVNGAGLAMATMDIIKLHGGEPANFLDVGGGATAERVTEAFKLILSNPKVKVVLVNIFGGIVRCDLIAEGIIQAVKEVGVNVPVIARLEGTNVIKGRELLANSGLDIITAEGLTDAAKKAVAAA